MKGPRRPAAFLDRDGVLNVDFDYVHRPEQWEWVPGAIEAIRLLNESGYWVIVATNQSGIGRGLYTEAEFRELCDWIDAQLAPHGAHIDATYHSPFHPTEGLGEYRRETDCRKPAPGMLLQAASEFEIDLARSFLIGDKERDVMAGWRADVRAYLFTEGRLDEFVSEVLAHERALHAQASPTPEA